MASKSSLVFGGGSSSKPSKEKKTSQYTKTRGFTDQHALHGPVGNTAFAYFLDSYWTPILEMTLSRVAASVHDSQFVPVDSLKNQAPMLGNYNRNSVMRFESPSEHWEEIYTYLLCDTYQTYQGAFECLAGYELYRNLLVPGMGEIVSKNVEQMWKDYTRCQTDIAFSVFRHAWYLIAQRLITPVDSGQSQSTVDNGFESIITVQDGNFIIIDHAGRSFHGMISTEAIGRSSKVIHPLPHEHTSPVCIPTRTTVDDSILLEDPNLPAHEAARTSELYRLLVDTAAHILVPFSPLGGNQSNKYGPTREKTPFTPFNGIFQEVLFCNPMTCPPQLWPWFADSPHMNPMNGTSIRLLNCSGCVQKECVLASVPGAYTDDRTVTTALPLRAIFGTEILNGMNSLEVAGEGLIHPIDGLVTRRIPFETSQIEDCKDWLTAMKEEIYQKKHQHDLSLPLMGLDFQGIHNLNRALQDEIHASADLIHRFLIDPTGVKDYKVPPSAKVLTCGISEDRSYYLQTKSNKNRMSATLEKDVLDEIKRSQLPLHPSKSMVVVAQSMMDRFDLDPNIEDDYTVSSVGKRIFDTLEKKLNASTFLQAEAIQLLLDKKDRDVNHILYIVDFTCNDSGDAPPNSRDVINYKYYIRRIAEYYDFLRLVGIKALGQGPTLTLLLMNFPPITESVEYFREFDNWLSSNLRRRRTQSQALYEEMLDDAHLPRKLPNRTELWRRYYTRYIKRNTNETIPYLSLRPLPPSASRQIKSLDLKRLTASPEEAVPSKRSRRYPRPSRKENTERSRAKSRKKSISSYEEFATPSDQSHRPLDCSAVRSHHSTSDAIDPEIRRPEYVETPYYPIIQTYSSDDSYTPETSPITARNTPTGGLEGSIDYSQSRANSSPGPYAYESSEHSISLSHDESTNRRRHFGSHAFEPFHRLSRPPFPPTTTPLSSNSKYYTPLSQQQTRDTNTTRSRSEKSDDDQFVSAMSTAGRYDDDTHYGHRHFQSSTNKGRPLYSSIEDSSKMQRIPTNQKARHASSSSEDSDESEGSIGLDITYAGLR